jgi:hypothetical protein
MSASLTQPAATLTSAAVTRVTSQRLKPLIRLKITPHDGAGIALANLLSRE